MAHLFVYGTLKRGGANHRVLAELGARFACEATTVERRTLVDLGPYPALLTRDAARDETATEVHGEIFEVDDAAMAVVDAFEGVPELYRREGVGLRAADGTARSAFTYALARRPPRHARVLADGRYAGGGDRLDEGVTEEQLEG